jgi:hypothetical protein
MPYSFATNDSGAQMAIVKNFLWTMFVGFAALVCLFFLTLGHGILTHARMARLVDSKTERLLDSPKHADAVWTMRGTR